MSNEDLDAEVETAVVGAMRVLTLSKLDRLANEQFIQRVDLFIELYLEHHCRKPMRSVKVRPLVYLINCDDFLADFTERVEKLSEGLQARLFGENEDARPVVVSKVGREEDVLYLTDASDDEIREEIAEEEAAKAEPGETVKPADLGETDTRSEKLKRTRYAYRAVVDLQRSLLIAFTVTVRVNPSSNTDLDTRSWFGYFGDEIAEVECEALNTAAKVARGFAKSGAAGLIMCPVSYETMAQAMTRAAYLDRVANLSPHVRERLIATVFDTPRDPGHQIVHLIASSLIKQFRMVDWQCSEGGIEVDRFRGAPIHSITLRPPTDPVMRRIEHQRFRTTARALRLNQIRAGMADILNENEIAAFRTAGVVYGSGEGVSPALDAPMTARWVDLEALPLEA